MFWPDPTYPPNQPPTDPPNHTPTHGWIILHRFQIFRWNWNILISSSDIGFLLIPGIHPRGVVDRLMGWVWVCVGCPMHACMDAHAHTCTCMLNMINMLNMDASMTVAICNFYTCIHVHVCMHVGTVPCPQTPPPTCPLPRAAGSPKQQNWTNRDNSILFEDSLPLNTPELI